MDEQVKVHLRIQANSNEVLEVGMLGTLPTQSFFDFSKVASHFVPPPDILVSGDFLFPTLRGHFILFFSSCHSQVQLGKHIGVCIPPPPVSNERCV